MGFRLIVTDLDDTLLDDKCCLSPRVKEAMRKARAKGVMVTFATGRMYQSALPYARELGLDIPLITYQGALVKTSVSGEVLYHRPLSQELAVRVIHQARQKGIITQLYLEDTLYVARMSPETENYIAVTGVEAKVVGDLLSFLDCDPTKILLIDRTGRLPGLWRDMDKEFQGEIFITQSKPHFLEFTHPQATKGHGLAAVAKGLGVYREEIIAFGDSYNDLELFRHAGFAVAVNNARPQVKQEADYVTRSNNEDGVAEAIEKFVLK